MAPETFQVSNNAAVAYEENVVKFMRPFVDAIVKHAELEADQALLDVACGTGFVARAAKQQTPDARVVGSDLNEGMLAVAAELDSAITWHAASADTLPFADAEFDVVTCQQGMQFFPDVNAAAKEMHRVLRPGGRALATAWATFERCPYLRAQCEAYTDHIDLDGEESFGTAVRFNADEYLRGAFSSAGFVSVEVSLVEAVVELGDVGAFARQQIVGTPWGPSFVAATKKDQQNFIETMVEILQSYAKTDGTFAVPFASFLAIARK